MSRSRPEETIVRQALPALSRVPGVLALRNEANALTALLANARREIGKALDGAERDAALAALNRAYSMMPDSIKFGLGVGSADVVCCVGGRFVALEFKSEDGTQSAEQRTWAGWIERAGGVYRVVRSVEEAVSAVHDAVPVSRLTD